MPNKTFSTECFQLFIEINLLFGDLCVILHTEQVMIYEFTDYENFTLIYSL